MAGNQGSSGAGVGDEMRQFAGRVGRVGHDFYGASPHRGQAGDEKLNGVLAHDQDSVAPADTTLHHPSCEAGDAVLQLSVGDRLVPHTYGDLVPVSFYLLREQVGYRRILAEPTAQLGDGRGQDISRHGADAWAGEDRTTRWPSELP